MCSFWGPGGEECLTGTTAALAGGRCDSGPDKAANVWPCLRQPPPLWGPGRGFEHVQGAPLPHKRRAGPRAVPSPQGPAGERPPAPLPPAPQPHAGFQQGARQPHKGNGDMVSHPEARLLPVLLAHKGPLCCSPGGRGGRAQGSRRFRALTHGPRGEAPPPEATLTAGRPRSAKPWVWGLGPAERVLPGRHLVTLPVPCEGTSCFTEDCLLYRGVRGLRPGARSFNSVFLP